VRKKEKYMKLRGKRLGLVHRIVLGIAFATVSIPAFAFLAPNELRFVQIAAKSKQERSAIANFGISIESIKPDSVWGFANRKGIEKLSHAGFKVLGEYDYQIARGGHENAFGFPPEDAKFHTYDQLTQALQSLQKQNSDIAALQSIGKTIEGRDIWAIHFNSSREALSQGVSNKPGVVFMGNHHAREHLSLEVPFMLAQYLMDHRKDSNISALLDTRDIWIIPMVNPDGAEYDIKTGRYQWWRKNRRDNGDGNFGVDLNRNYGFQWGTGGSDHDTSSEVYMGKEPFSEPETQAIRDFIDNRPNTKVLLSFHTFSELILYPWGHKYDAISNTKDFQVFEKMAKTMAQWNRYTPEQSSDLYIASGDTTDWAYGAHGIFAFTFELSPSSLWQGGFYPGAKVIDKVFAANLQPCLYLIKMAGDPYQVLENHPTDGLRHYVQPRLPEAAVMPF
jgi:carboxypeptidase T